MGKLVVFDLWIGPQHGVVALKHTQAKGGMDSAIGAGSWRMTLQCEGGIRFVRVNHPMMPRRPRYVWDKGSVYATTCQAISSLACVSGVPATTRFTV